MATESNQAARLIRELREAAGLTQRELAERIDSTQSVISRLESDDYEGHSLSMLYRVARAVGRRIELRVVDESVEVSEREGLMRLRGCLKVGRGSTVDDVRRAREQRGRDIAARS